MTEEIKEIFYKLRSDDYYEKHYQQSAYYEKDLNKLENYITNLQKENEVNKTYYDFYKDMSDKWKNLSDVYKKNYKDYKQRNEKAVEYIKERKDLNWYVDGVFVYELLNILQGGDE